jgi:hypothetical protein
MMKRLRIQTAPLLLFLLAAVMLTSWSAPADATPVWGTSALDSLEGSRSGNQLGGSGAWAKSEAQYFSISWDIVQNQNASFTYQYTLNFKNTEAGVNQEAKPSHFILEITEGVDRIDDLIAYTYTENDSNPNMPNKLYGVKFDYGSWTYTLTTSRSPVWGNFYAKDGNAGDLGKNAIWNAGLEYEDYMTKETLTSDYFIVRPDGAAMAHAPEPSTLLLVGAGLAGLAFARKRRK